MRDRRHKRTSRASTRTLLSEPSYYEEAENVSVHRKLRLRTDTNQTFKFRSELVEGTCKQRIEEFNFAYSRLPDYLKGMLDNIDQSLHPFGYKLKEPYHHLDSSLSILQPWEI